MPSVPGRIVRRRGHSPIREAVPPIRLTFQLLAVATGALLGHAAEPTAPDPDDPNSSHAARVGIHRIEIVLPILGIYRRYYGLKVSYVGMAGAAYSNSSAVTIG